MSLEQLTHIDSVFLEVERPNTPMHTAGVVIFEETIDFAKVFETLESRLVLVPRFTQRVVEVPLGLGYPFWAPDPSFDLSYHLRHAALPEPGDDETLCDYAARLISRPLDRTKPLWEIYIIDGLEGGRSAMVTKTHHAMVDGLSTMDLATVLFDFTPEVAQPLPKKAEPATHLPSSLSLIRESLGLQARSVLDAGNLIRAAAAAPRRTVRASIEAGGAALAAITSTLRPAGITPINVGPGLHRRYAIVRRSLQTFKDIKNAATSTVNDAVLSVCADAIGRLFRARGEATEGTSLRVMVPVSVRQEARKVLGNEITAVFCDLPIGKMKPADRLSVVHDQMKDVKRSKKAVGAELLVELGRWAPSTLHALAARVGARARLMNTIVSNVPGPQVPLYSCGVKMLEPYAVIPLARGQSLAIGVTSYNGGVFFGLNADRDSMPDLPQLARYLDESITELEKATAGI